MNKGKFVDQNEAHHSTGGKTLGRAEQLQVLSRLQKEVSMMNAEYRIVLIKLCVVLDKAGSS